MLLIYLVERAHLIAATPEGDHWAGLVVGEHGAVTQGCGRYRAEQKRKGVEANHSELIMKRESARLLMVKRRDKEREVVASEASTYDHRCWDAVRIHPRGD